MVLNTRRRYDKKFKEAAVKMVVEEGLSAAEVERQLTTGIGIVARWVKNSCQKRGQQRLPGDEQNILKEEISRLRKELDQAKQERETLMSCLKALSAKY